MSISATVANIKASNHKLNVKGFEISGTNIRFTIRPVVQCSPRKKVDGFTPLILF